MLPRFEIVAVTAEASPKAAPRNQDRALVFHVESGRCGAGVVVCDGVGSLARSGDVAERVAQLAANHALSFGITSGVSACAQYAAHALGPVEDGATTLIAVGADELGFVAFTQVGNGSLFDITVDTDLGTPRLHTAELTTPHVSFADGRPLLSSFLPAASPEHLAAVSGVLLPCPGRVRVLLACSDGVATGEERAIGIAPDGSQWRFTPRPLSTLLGDLTSGWTDVLGSEDLASALGALLQRSLDALAADDRLDDDATVGVVFVRAADGARP